MNRDERFILKIQGLILLAILVFCFSGIYVESLLFAERGSNLIISERGGWMIVNTDPQMPIDLNPYKQPRISIEMKWRVDDIENYRIKLTFLYLGKREMCPEVRVMAVDLWRDIGDVRYEPQITKGGEYKKVIVEIDSFMFKQICYQKPPIHFKVCEIEFLTSDREYWMLKEALRIWERR